MNKHNRLLTWAALALLLVSATYGHATADSGPVVGWWVVGAGGDVASGGDVTLSDTLGQPAGGPPSSGGNVTMDAGYRQVLGPAAILDLRTSVPSARMQLDWSPVGQDVGGRSIANVTYNIYRDQVDPYFSPAATYASELTAATFTDDDTGVAGNTAHATYYCVKAVYSGLLAEPSNLVGAFAFRLVPGE